MAFVCVDKDSTEWITDIEPYREESEYCEPYQWNLDFMQAIQLPKGSIKKLIGRDLTWEDKPVELK